MVTLFAFLLQGSAAGALVANVAAHESVVTHAFWQLGGYLRILSVGRALVFPPCEHLHCSAEEHTKKQICNAEIHFRFAV